MDSANVCVLGGGVVGLTTALTVLDRYPKATVTIMADKFNTETTSDGAAGLFYPFASFKAKTFDMAKRIVKDSYVYYDRLMKVVGEAPTGISEICGYVLSNISQEEVECPVLIGAVPEYKTLTPEEVAKCPGQWTYGCYLKTLLINGRLFLPWALRNFQERGGKVVQRRILSFKELVPFNFDVVLNCTGLGAQALCNDMELIPVRGQVIKVSAPWVTDFYLVDDSIYVIPGFETTLGGCKNYNDYSLDIDKGMSSHIWRNCTKLIPSLKECAVIRDWVGLRPHREPIRLEPEILNIDGTELKIVHNYGHGSQGVTTAPGSAIYCVDYAVELVTGQR